jgi:filamentous hemagglutinin
LQTYFVGGDAWGFALWSHNTNGHQAGSTTPLTQAQQRAISKIYNTIQDHLTVDDITGALRDATGNPVPKPSGGFYNHAGEVNEAINGLRNQLRLLEGINAPEAQAAQNAIQQVESALQGAGI